MSNPGFKVEGARWQMILDHSMPSRGWKRGDVESVDATCNSCGNAGTFQREGGSAGTIKPSIGTWLSCAKCGQTAEVNVYAVDAGG